MHFQLPLRIAFQITPGIGQSRITGEFHLPRPILFPSPPEIHFMLIFSHPPLSIVGFPPRCAPNAEKIRAGFQREREGVGTFPAKLPFLANRTFHIGHAKRPPLKWKANRKKGQATHSPFADPVKLPSSIQSIPSRCAGPSSPLRSLT